MVGTAAMCRQPSAPPPMTPILVRSLLRDDNSWGPSCAADMSRGLHSQCSSSRRLLMDQVQLAEALLGQILPACVIVQAFLTNPFSLTLRHPYEQSCVDQNILFSLPGCRGVPLHARSPAIGMPLWAILLYDSHNVDKRDLNAVSTGEYEGFQYSVDVCAFATGHRHVCAIHPGWSTFRPQHRQQEIKLLRDPQ